ncbi:phosphoribosylamine--glycine ligase [Lacticaseibacillus zhaodongensis]|uniref:phosphoribosylamine--glycine ligase n=1 Tax=Lacticaseibacillus zhaodongensis TaxID=2668065 RepID=UPI0012D31682|nr:phosphoribosylamine--glycine ligase [Lacticaseibacillus zhaodongensis]
MTNVLIVGSGARETALGLKFLASPQVDQVYVAPGGDGMDIVGLHSVAIDVMDFPALIEFAAANVALTFVGPEQPLVAGITDAFTAAGLPIFGVTKAAARLEGSKTYAKHFMAKHDLPTARAKSVQSLSAALSVLDEWGVPIVIKADGLAGGKGVVVAQDVDTARAAIDRLYAADAAAPVLIEEFLAGQEASVMALFAGQNAVILPLSQDHKRRYDDDRGPNTGGMGAVSPLPQFTQQEQAAATALMRQTVAALVADGVDSCGVIYMGLIFTAAEPKILEYNMRFGDPETQVLLPQIQNDFYALVTDLMAGKQPELQLDGQTYVGVVLTHPDYPVTSKPALPVVQPDTALLAAHAWIPAAVSKTAGGLVSTGGRVLTIVGSGTDAGSATKAAYALVQQYAGQLAYRSDIAHNALVTSKQN